MPSAVIRGFQYIREDQELVVTFTTGRVYAYAAVPADVADAFKLAFSKGAFFNANIRDRFGCREIVGTA